MDVLVYAVDVFQLGLYLEIGGFIVSASIIGSERGFIIRGVIAIIIRGVNVGAKG